MTTPGRMVCTKCGGLVVPDEDAWRCYMCGKRFYLKEPDAGLLWGNGRKRGNAARGLGFDFG